jgi:hypothetical protein
MKKADMIKTIQQEEAKMWLEVKRSELTYGQDSTIHAYDRTRWSAVHDLMRLLDINPDYTLLEAKQATQIIIERELERTVTEQFEQEDFDKKDINV